MCCCLCLTHDSITVHLFQHLLFLEEIFGEKPKNVFYLSDGCAGQHKTCKNLCHHSVDYGFEAEWHLLPLYTARGHAMVMGGGVTEEDGNKG